MEMPGSSPASTPESNFLQNAPWEAACDGPRSWVLPNHMGDPDCAPCSVPSGELADEGRTQYAHIRALSALRSNEQTTTTKDPSMFQFGLLSVTLSF